jgi:hypothetical protein
MLISLSCPKGSSLGIAIILGPNLMTTWEFTIDPTDEFLYISTAISDKFVMIGYPYSDEGYVAYYSLAAILRADTSNRNGDRLYCSDGQQGDWFGYMISLNENQTAYISAPYHRSTGTVEYVW